MKFGGFTLGEGDVIRNALKKKQLDILQAKEPDFVKFFVENFSQYGEEKARELWSQLKPFSDYGFNKAHSASYAVVAYWCAYLKAHYPLEFVTALMHSDVENTDRVIVDIKEARRMGYEVLPPSVNDSDVYFNPEDGNKIRFGLAAIKNVGTKLCETIVKERGENGKYSSFDDLVKRVGTSEMSKKAAECLIKTGALDEFGDRNALQMIIPMVYDKVEKDKKASEIGQTDLFGASMVNDGPAQTYATPFPEFRPATDKEKMEWEKDLMGLYLSSHPLKNFEWTLLSKDVFPTDELDNISPGKSVKTIGLLTSIKITYTKADNNKMAIVKIEDMHGGFDSVIFPKMYEKLSEKELIQEGRAFLITGNINQRDDRKSFVIEDIEPANVLVKPKKVSINIIGITDQTEIQELKSAFSDEGDIEVEIKYGSAKEIKTLQRKIDSTNETAMRVVRRYLE